MIHGKHNIKQVKTPFQVSSITGILIWASIMFNLAWMFGVVFWSCISRENSARRCTLETKACCIKVEKESRRTYEDNVETRYYPVFRYTVHEKTYEGRAHTSGDKDEYVKGNYYQIYVDPDEPDDFVTPRGKNIKTSDKWLCAGIVLGLELILSYFLISEIRKKRRQNKTSDHCGTDDEYDDYR